MIHTATTSDLPEPLIPADVSFPSYLWTPLDINAVTEGELSFLSGDGFKAAIMLMMKSWQEKPAASLPDDDRRLAAFCGFGRGPAALALWEAVKVEALSDFTLCSDGRRYSRTLAPQALEAWESRRQQIERTRKAREARNGNRQTTETTSASVAEIVTASVTEPATASVTASIRDQTTSDHTTLDHTASDQIAVVAGKGGVGGRPSQPVPRRKAGSITKPIVISQGTISPGTANRWAGQFNNLPDIEAAIREAAQSPMPENEWMGTIKARVSEQNDKASEAMVGADCPF
ncbi:hypothetical protein ACFZ8E_23420 [Methylobacterium sp. HMF5984]|uniref:hypothetical protein n=1 Tax=Methylobacterium sp. HMF5984 TaxID=3367370 RepID=UPI003852841F